VHAVYAPDGEHIRGVATADINNVLRKQERPNIFYASPKERQVRRFAEVGRIPQIKCLDIRRRVAAGRRQKADARFRFTRKRYEIIRREFACWRQLEKIAAEGNNMFLVHRSYKD